jgi:hypothetical protein
MGTAGSLVPVSVRWEEGTDEGVGEPLLVLTEAPSSFADEGVVGVGVGDAPRTRGHKVRVSATAQPPLAAG